MTIYCPQRDQHCSLHDSAGELDKQGLPTIAFPPIKGWFQKIYRWLVIRHERKINRDAFLHLLKLEDELLDDVGVTRDSVRWAASLPLSVDAAKALEGTTKRPRTLADRDNCGV